MSKEKTNYVTDNEDDLFQDQLHSLPVPVVVVVPAVVPVPYDVANDYDNEDDYEDEEDEEYAEPDMLKNTLEQYKNVIHDESEMAQDVADDYDNEDVQIAAVLVQSKKESQKQSSFVDDEDHELMEALAMIAAQEEAERHGTSFDAVAAAQKFNETSGFEIIEDTFQFPDCQVYFGQCYRKSDGTLICHGHGQVLNEMMDFDNPIYVGEFVHGKKQGHGIFYDYHSQLRIEGSFNNDWPHGQCTTYTLHQGQQSIKVFEGEYKQGKPNGYGRYYYNGNIFVGQQQGMYVNGEGVIINTRSGKEVVIYRGNIKKNVRHGHGTELIDGVEWTGEFNQGQMDGDFESTDGYVRTIARFEQGVKKYIVVTEIVRMTTAQREELMQKEVEFFRKEVQIEL